MTHAEDRDPAIAYLSHITELIEEHGWAVQGVGGDECQPGFAYTVGLSLYGSPELILFGAPFGAATRVLDDLGARIRDGARYVHGQVLDDVIAPAPVILLDVADTTEHLLIAQKVAGAIPPGRQGVRAWQVVYPDNELRWPWQTGSQVADLPVLGLVPDGF